MLKGNVREYAYTLQEHSGNHLKVYQTYAFDHCIKFCRKCHLKDNVCEQNSEELDKANSEIKSLSNLFSTKVS